MYSMAGSVLRSRIIEALLSGSAHKRSLGIYQARSRLKGNRVGVEKLGLLLIHGFTADHHGMRPIAEIAEELGLAVEMPLLRGHGLTYRDLRGVCWDDWVADVSQALAALKQRAERVIIAGFSLGGLLALATAAQHEDLDSIVALAPALRIAHPLAPLAPLARGWMPFVPMGKSVAYSDPSLALGDTSSWVDTGHQHCELLLHFRHDEHA